MVAPLPLTTAGRADLLIELVGNEGRPQTRDDLSRRVFNRNGSLMIAALMVWW